jgi:hypothetical protein
MKYLVALLIFFGMITFTIVTPASHAQAVLGHPRGYGFGHERHGFVNRVNGFGEPGFLPQGSPVIAPPCSAPAFSRWCPVYNCRFRPFL